MSVKVRKFRSGGYEVDIHTQAPDGMPIRERIKAPVASKEAAKRWGMLREAHLALMHGEKGCRCKAHGKEGEGEDPRTLSVEQLVESWIKQRKDEGIPYVEVEEQRLRAHILPVLGKLKVIDVRPKHAYQLVKELARTKSKRGGMLAPRTVRGIYFTARQVLQHAVLEELIPGNPMTLAKGVLPPVQDKDPTWRSQAVFTSREVEMLICDPRVAAHRRVAYALEFLTGLRTGQVSALRWSDYDGDIEPLGRITSSLSWSSRHKKEKATKTGVTHEVPVHRTLAKVLAQWKLAGWTKWMGKPPSEGDLIIPNINGNHRDVRKALEDFHEDLGRLGLRKRRHYDARRTFISLGLDGGASKDLLQGITHPRPADAFDLYRTPAWAARCEAVSKLKVELLEGEILQLKPAAGSGRTGDVAETMRTVKG